MAAYHDKLRTIWTDLQNSALVKTKVTSRENIEEFSILINKLLPLTAQDVVVWDFVKGMFLQEKVRFYEYIAAINAPYFVLMVGCGAVIAELKITGLVDIRLFSDKSRFIVQPSAQDTTVRPPRGPRGGPPRNQRNNKRGGRRGRAPDVHTITGIVSRPIAIPAMPEERLQDIARECAPEPPTRSYAEAAKGVNKTAATEECTTDNKTAPEPLNWADE